jgi:hypothetical protein
MRSPCVTTTEASVLPEDDPKPEDVACSEGSLVIFCFFEFACSFFDFTLRGSVLSDFFLVPKEALKIMALNKGVNNSRCTGSATGSCAGPGGGGGVGREGSGAVVVEAAAELEPLAFPFFRESLEYPTPLDDDDVLAFPVVDDDDDDDDEEEEEEEEDEVSPPPPPDTPEG